MEEGGGGERFLAGRERERPGNAASAATDVTTWSGARAAFSQMQRARSERVIERDWRIFTSERRDKRDGNLQDAVDRYLRTPR